MSEDLKNNKVVSFDTLTDSCVGRLVERVCDNGKAGDRFKYYNHDVRVDGKGDSSITVTVDGILLYTHNPWENEVILERREFSCTIKNRFRYVYGRNIRFVEKYNPIK